MAGVNSSKSIQDAKKHLKSFIKEVQSVTDQEMEILRIKIEERAKMEVPVKSGALQESIKVSTSRSTKLKGINVRASARNPKTGFDYALAQHENITYSHSVGKSHYLSDPFNKEVAHFKKRIKRRLAKNG